MHTPQSSLLLLSLLLAPVPSLAVPSLRCENVLVDKHRFDLSKLEGPHSVVTSWYEASDDTHYNTTYTLDICKPLTKDNTQCPSGTRVTPKPGDKEKDQVVAIAGDLLNVGGAALDAEFTRLKTSDSNSDSQKEGLRIVLKGGKDPLNGPVKKRRDQKAIIEFLCDPDKTGKEGEWGVEEDKEKLRRRDDKQEGDDKEGDDKKGDDKDGGKEGGDKDGDKDGDQGGDDSKEKDGEEVQFKHDNSALIWESYSADRDADVLRLTWYTKYACEKREDSEDPDDSNSSAHWGFFTWFVIIVFLGIATYLIFGSWLNYNRYGARGWDLIPHGDTLRDVPYLLKDWVRRVLNTVQGAGSRGGYSAV